jgi:hypothetical protein
LILFDYAGHLTKQRGASGIATVLYTASKGLTAAE